MSRLWPEHIYASLAPGNAALLCVRAGWRRSVAARHAAQVAALPDQPWQAELEALASLLAEHSRKKSCAVVLSNHYVRYQPLPAVDAAMSEDEIHALARHCFVETYGEAARDWTIRISGWRTMPLSLVACAVDASLLAGLQEVCTKAGARLTSVQPYLAAGFKLTDKRIRSRRACFVQKEHGRLVMAMLEAGAWRGVRSLAIGDGWMEELDACMKRETLLAGWSNEPIAAFLHLPEPAAQVQMNIGEQGWQRLTAPALDGFSPARDAAFALAASGVW